MPRLVIALGIGCLAVAADAATYHRSFRNGYPVGVRSQTSTSLSGQAAVKTKASATPTLSEKLVNKLLPPDKMMDVAGFFGPVTKKYLPTFEEFNSEYLTSDNRAKVVAKYLPSAEAALKDARAMRVPAKYEKQKADYIRIFDTLLASARLTAKFAK